jgi:para-aminobenzoate synthetase component I
MMWLEDIVGEKDFFLRNTNDGNFILGVDKLHVFNGLLNDLQPFLDDNKGDFVFVALSYDLKNEIENLESNNPTEVNIPNITAFVPKYIYKSEIGGFKIINQVTSEVQVKSGTIELKGEGESYIKLISPLKEDYFKHFENIQSHISRGNCYEINYCTEFKGIGKLDIFSAYKRLNKLSLAPHSFFVRHGNFAHVGASPERFFKKEGSKIISEPIKGTSRKGLDKKENELLAKELLNSEKERAENIMIVDLVRNDLNKICKTGTVIVENLCKLVTLKTVHQLVSTISGELSKEVSFVDIIKSLYPMGSMTGAPKVSSMKIIEEEENFKRGMYSGSIGVIEPNGDVDMNVVIRSINADISKEILSVGVGSAITSKSEVNKEYEECLLKFDVIKRSLSCH